MTGRPRAAEASTVSVPAAAACRIGDHRHASVTMAISAAVCSSDHEPPGPSGGRVNHTVTQTSEMRQTAPTAMPRTRRVRGHPATSTPSVPSVSAAGTARSGLVPGCSAPARARAATSGAAVRSTRAARRSTPPRSGSAVTASLSTNPP
ncbi:hypothetical protein ACFQX6_09945 [Streptosporangium lutulentum]